MKNLNSITLIISFLMFFSCTKQEEKNDLEINLNQKELSDIKSFAKGVFVELDKVSDQNLISHYNSQKNIIHNAINKNSLSPSMKNYMSAIKNSSGFSTSDQYIKYLNNILEKAKEDITLSTEEIKSIMIVVKTMEEFIYYGNEFFGSNKSAKIKANISKYASSTPYDVAPENTLIEADGKSWWSRWGKCVSGVVGGALTGGLAGAAVTTPTVVGVPVGAAVGAVGGGLLAAAEFCDSLSSVEELPTVNRDTTLDIAVPTP